MFRSKKRRSEYHTPCKGMKELEAMVYKLMSEIRDLAEKVKEKYGVMPEVPSPATNSAQDTCTTASSKVPQKAICKDKSVDKAKSRHSPSIGKTKVSRPSSSINGKKKLSDQQTVSSSNDSKKYIAYTKMHALYRISIPMDEEVLGLEQTLTINREVLKRVYNNEVVSTTVIRAYVRYLYYDILVPLQQTQRFVFLCPEHTFLYNLPLDHKDATSIMETNKNDITSYVSQRLKLAQNTSYDTMFLAPIYLGVYWILLAINPKRNTVYYLDSLQGHYNNHPKLIEIINSCLATYGAFSETRTKWIPIDCPKQQNNNDCGYYVMKYMKEIITHNQMQIPKMYFTDCRFKEYSDEHLIELKGEWCRYVVHFFN